jgi:hypothetical protein
MFYDEHNPPHLHADYQGEKAVFDFQGNVISGNLNSRTATKLVREWIDLNFQKLEKAWDDARNFRQIRKIPPLD